LKKDVDLVSKHSYKCGNLGYFRAFLFYQLQVKAIELLHKAHVGVAVVHAQSEQSCSQWLFGTYQSHSVMIMFVLESEEITP